ncbi:urokinase plasminogen activator surface receptor [Oryzias melastigma]|uniref:Urokinase plasminogen activator surface receptor-like n=1 Tax=Oryzias melastigma TaxID=30732 RepID=A0A3B3CGG4_ORYME|nr:urokinase plasminogen activator surface receptor [Oryzias melastigma]
MYRFALILGIWLLPKGDTLKCYECMPDASGNCLQTEKQCLSQSYQCGASRVVSYAGGSKLLDLQVKACGPPEECGEASINFGLSKTSVNTKCCNSDLCNSMSAPEPSKTAPNGGMCYTCDGSTCEKTLACEGNEDHCITATASAGGTTVTLKGCASKIICSSKNYVSQLSGAKISCCKGNLCNSAVTASAGLQLVVVALVSVALFS